MYSAPQHVTELTHSGIHEINGLRYLFQATSPEGWSYVGLKNPTQHTSRHLKTCTHGITPTMGFRETPRTHWSMFESMANDPLVQAMLPIPKKDKAGTGVYYINERQLPQYLEILACLERMSSPVHRSLRSWWSSRPTAVSKELGYTNLHPLVVHNVGQNDAVAVRKLMREALSSPRTLIVVGEDLVFDDSVTPIQTLLGSYKLDELIAMPWEQIGANVVCNYCRFNPITKAIDH